MTQNQKLKARLKELDHNISKLDAELKVLQIQARLLEEFIEKDIDTFDVMAKDELEDLHNIPVS